MPESENDFIGLDFELEYVVQFDHSPFYLGGGGLEPQRKPEVVVVRARRRYGGTELPKFLRQIPYFQQNEPVPVDPWVLRANPCADVPNATGRKLLYTESEDGTNVYVVPPNFSFQELVTRSNQIKTEVAAIIDANPVIGQATARTFVLRAFANLVKTGGPYDWKNTGQKARNPNGTLVTFRRGTQNIGVYEPFGNWVYGFFGSMIGIPREVLSVGANVAQIQSSFNLDDPIDQANINLGIDAFQNANQPFATDELSTSTDPIIAALVAC
jgi:hypothetical protein